MTNLSHLQEVDTHPELLCPLLMSFWRYSSYSLHYQTKGDVILFNSPALSEPVPVLWDGEQYLPARLHNGKVEALSLTYRDKGIREQGILTAGIQALYGLKG